MRNVTISMTEELARWVRIQAAEHDVSVSRYIRDLLAASMERARAYEAAKRRNLARPPKNIGSGEPYPERGELHDRAQLRR